MSSSIIVALIILVEILTMSLVSKEQRSHVPAFERSDKRQGPELPEDYHNDQSDNNSKALTYFLMSQAKRSVSCQNKPA